MPMEENRARQILRDVRAGVDDSEIMEKYGISSVDLQNLLKQFVTAGLLRQSARPSTPRPKRSVNVKEIVRDISLGLSNDQLMEKYRLSPAMLQKVCKKLLDSRVITRDQLFNSFLEATVVEDVIRDRQRSQLDFDLLVYEAEHPEIVGRLRDVSEEGVGLEGIESKIGAIQKIVVLGDLFGEIAPFEFQARCRWFTEARQGETCIGGYEITRISDEANQELDKLIRLVTLRA
jgi:uncharacterized protein (DUF433 family)